MKVLVPYDGAELSEQAAITAIELLAQHRLDILVLRVVPDQTHVAEARASLEAAAARIGESPAAVTPILAIGSPAELIVECADQHGADLIAMSTHGRSTLVRMFVGSVTDRVIRTSPVPVLVLHPPSMSIDRLTPPTGRKLRVLAPYDGSRFAEEAIQMAASLLRPELIEISLLTVLTMSTLQPTATELIEQLVARLRERGVTTSAQIVRGDVVPQITQIATDGAYDLIVMSTHGHGLLTRALVGSATDAVVREAAVPVLVIQPASMEVPYDPVSGEEIDPEKASYTSEYHGRTFYFTSFEHKREFDGDPEAFIGRRLARPTGFSSPLEGMATQPGTVPPLAREV